MDEKDKVKKPFASTKLGIATNTLLGLPKAALNFAKDVVQGTARSIGSVGVQLQEARTGREMTAPKPDTTTTSGKLQKLVFGDEPIRSVSGNILETKRVMNEMGFNPTITKLSAAPLVVGFTALDFIPGAGGASKKAATTVAKTLSKVDDVAEVAKVLKNSNIADDVIQRIAPKIAKTTKESDIRYMFNEAVMETASGVAKSRAAKAAKTVPQTFRADKLDVTPEVADQVLKRMQSLGMTTRTVRTFDDIEEAAQILGYKGSKQLIDDVNVNALQAEEVVALRNTISRLATEINDINKAAAVGPLDEVAQMALSEREALLDEALKKVTKGGTELGRAVAAYRIMAKQSLDPAVWYQQAMKNLGANQEFTPAIRKTIDDLIAAKDLDGLAAFTASLKKADLIDKILTLRKAGLLTSPTTWMANILGNTTIGGLETLSDIPATTADMLISLFTGKRTTTINPSTIGAKIRGATEGLKEGVNFVKTGVYPRTLLNKYDIPDKIMFENKILRAYTNTIFNSLTAGDIVFRKAAMSEALESSAQIIARNEGLVGKAAKDRIRGLLMTPTNEMVTAAIDAAEYATFQGSNVFSKMFSGAKRSVKSAGAGGRAVAGAIDYLVPFVQTPTNVAIALADYTPLGFIRGLTRLANPSTRSQKDFVKRLGRSVTGTGVIALGAYLHSKGMMTGNTPESEAERADFYASGKQPQSVFVDGYWLRLNRISPLGNLLALGAELNQIQDEEDKQNAFTAAMSPQAFGAGVRTIAEQTFVTGIQTGIDALMQPERSAQKFFEGQVASLVPSIVGRIARTIDPQIREADGVIETVQSRIPGASKSLPVKRDVFGRKVDSPSGRAAIIDPFSTSAAYDSPVLKEFEAQGLTVGLPSRTQMGVKMTNEEYDLYQKMQGWVLEEAMLEVISSDAYLGLPDYQKARILERTKEQVRGEVQSLIMPQIILDRYNIDKPVPAEVIGQLMTELNRNKDYQEATEEEKKNIVGNILKRL